MHSKLLCGVALGVALAITGCSTTTHLEPSSTNSAGAGAGAASGGTQPMAKTAVQPVVANPLDDPKSPLAARSVYFDLDSYVIHANDTVVLDNHGKYLLSHPTAALRLEGNADERGGREYNLALGQKRAEAALKALRLLGVAETRMEAISYGKEKPVALGHDEESWSKNRRADLSYKTR